MQCLKPRQLDTSRAGHVSTGAKSVEHKSVRGAELKVYLCEVASRGISVEAGEINAKKVGLHPKKGFVGHLSIQVGI